MYFILKQYLIPELQAWIYFSPPLNIKWFSLKTKHQLQFKNKDRREKINKQKVKKD